MGAVVSRPAKLGAWTAALIVFAVWLYRHGDYDGLALFWTIALATPPIIAVLSEVNQEERDRLFDPRPLPNERPRR